jgi:hypothetical protein
VLTNNFGGVKVYTDTNRYPNNIDTDSSCSVPFGSGSTGQQSNNTTYYRQTKTLQISGNADISGSVVSTSNGTQSLCEDYTATRATETDATPGAEVETPEVGMGVYNESTGSFLGNIATVTSANSFTLNDSPGNATNASLLMSAYGGCGPADYYQSGPGVDSGTPSADYWDNCIWGSRNVTVSGNTFTTNAATITGCTTADLCGFMMAEAFNAGVPTLMQVFDDYTNLIAKASNGLGNVWSDNTYTWSSGSGTPTGWQFWAGTQGDQVTQSVWQNTYGQDAGSTFNAALPPTVDVTSLADNDTINGPTVTISASATPNDGGDISSGTLSVDGTDAQTLTGSAPFSFSLDTLNYTEGSHTVKIQVTDNLGDTGTESIPVYITNGDLNGDGRVNLTDLIILAENYGKSGTLSYAQGNITGATSGTEVGLSDLIILARNYGYNDGLGH